MLRLLSLDFDPVFGEAARASFDSDLSVFDFDVVIWDPATSLKRYISAYHSRHQGLPSLSEHESVRIVADLRRRRSELKEFVDTGRSLIVISRPPQVCFVDTGTREYSGTGRNRATTRIVEQVDLLSALPITGAEFLTASGSEIDLDGGGPFVDLLRNWFDWIRYDAVIKAGPGTAIAHVTGTDRTVSTVSRSTGGGLLVLLPVVDLYDAEPGEDQYGEVWADVAPEFQADLLQAVQDSTDVADRSRPPWTARFTTTRQAAARVAIVVQQTEVEVARSKLAELVRGQDAIDARDQLFIGTGRAVELEVRAVLELLGGKVSEPAPGRDDWKVEFPEGRAVVEVKGVAKSAAEKHAAQLEKWVATELESTGQAPKGILIVNTWRELPLDERTEVDFPTQMLPYCESRGHCLVTGLQLFSIREEVEAAPERAEHWRKQLLETSGVLTGTMPWTDYIKPVEEHDAAAGE